MSKTLDRKRPYITICGGTFNASFKQDGVYFDHEGQPVPQLSDRLDEGGDGQPAPAPQPAAAPTIAGTGAPAEPVIDAQTIINARRGELMPRAIVLLEGKADDIVAELADHDEEMLAVMLEVEGLVKKRVSVTAALTEALQGKMAESQRNAAAQGQAMNVPTATFGSMDGQSQLAAQLTSGG